MSRKFLLATDGSEYALKAARYAHWLASNVEDAELTVVFVGYVPPDAAAWINVDIGTWIQEVAQDVLDRTMAALDGATYPITRCVLEGHPATEICGLAEREGVDMIILGSRGLRALGRLFLGSVSDQVAHHAHCAVLIVK